MEGSRRRKGADGSSGGDSRADGTGGDSQDEQPEVDVPDGFDPTKVEPAAEEDKAIFIDQNFRSTLFPKLTNTAGDLVDKLQAVIEQQLDAGEQADGPDDVDQEQAQQAVLDATLSFSIEFDYDELVAFHEFLANLTKSVEGYTDQVGDPIVWKDKDQDFKEEFFDRQVGASTKVRLYINAYLLKTGMHSTGDNSG